MGDVEQKFILFQFWRLEVWNQAAQVTLLLEAVKEKKLSHGSCLASGGGPQSLSSPGLWQRNTNFCLHFHMVLCVCPCVRAHVCVWVCVYLLLL